jgi:hypothetical protein
MDSVCAHCVRLGRLETANLNLRVFTMYAHLRHSHTVGSGCVHTVRPGRLETAHSQSEGAHNVHTYYALTRWAVCVRTVCV